MFQQESDTERVTWHVPEFQQERSTWEKIFGDLATMKFDTDVEKRIDPSGTFEQALARNLEPNLSLEELSVRVVESVLELEYGDQVEQDMSFAKMTGALAEALRSSPEMREVLLAVANRTLRTKLNVVKKTVH